MMLHEYEGGWEFNSHYDTSTSSWLGGVCVEQIHHMPPDEAAALSNGQLRQTPSFLDFVNPEMHSFSNGLIVATNSAVNLPDGNVYGKAIRKSLYC